LQYASKVPSTFLVKKEKVSVARRPGTQRLIPMRRKIWQGTLTAEKPARPH